MSGGGGDMVGRTFRIRNGKTAIIEAYCQGSPHPWRGALADGSQIWWCESGRYVDTGERPLDLMEFPGPGVGDLDSAPEAVDPLIEALSEALAARVAREYTPINHPEYCVSSVWHPEHYSPDSVEVIDAIEAWDLGFHLGNAVKYIARAGKKSEDPREDLEKAVWYLRRYLDNPIDAPAENDS